MRVQRREDASFTALRSCPASWLVAIMRSLALDRSSFSSETLSLHQISSQDPGSPLKENLTDKELMNVLTLLLSAVLPVCTRPGPSLQVDPEQQQAAASKCSNITSVASTECSTEL